MHEVIHLSLSAKANHLTTHFYNAQESYFVFNEKDAHTRSHVDPTVLFKAGVATDRRTPTFTPRALIWDMRGGYGSLKRSNGLYNEDYTGHHDPTELQTASQVWDQTKPLTVIKQDQVILSEYQHALDTGTQVAEKAGDLNTQNTKYWSDYVNIYYNPKSFNQLSNWEYDPVRYPQGKPRGEEPKGGRKFVNYDTGVAEFKELNVASDDSYLEAVFRPAVEECDSLSGVSIATECDTAWGGFSSKILQELREDYIPKSSVFVWGLYDDDNSLGKTLGGNVTGVKNIKQTRQQVLSRIKTTISLANDATLFIPITKPRVPKSVLKNYDATSDWHSTALLTLPFESMSVLSSLRHENRVSMQSIADMLQGGSNRNIVASLESVILGPQQDRNVLAATRKKLDFDYSGAVFKDSTAHYFSKVGTLRPPSLSGSTGAAAASSSSSNSNSNSAATTDTRLNTLSLRNNLSGPDSREVLWEELFHGAHLQADGTPQALLSDVKCNQPFSLQKAFPGHSALEMEPEDSVFAAMGITTAPRKYLKEMHEFVSRYVRTADEGRDELKEDSSALAEQYEWGWNSSDDEEDDD